MSKSGYVVVDDEFWARAERKSKLLRNRTRVVIRKVRRAPRMTWLRSKWAYQRVGRGWDDYSLSSLDHHLTKTLGAQLVALADRTHGWPGEDEFGSFEEWQAALRKHGGALLAYAADAETGFDQYEKLHPQAKEALEWVGEWLGALWD